MLSELNDSLKLAVLYFMFMSVSLADKQHAETQSSVKEFKHFVVHAYL